MLVGPFPLTAGFLSQVLAPCPVSLSLPLFSCPLWYHSESLRVLYPVFQVRSCIFLAFGLPCFRQWERCALSLSTCSLISLLSGARYFAAVLSIRSLRPGIHPPSKVLGTRHSRGCQIVGFSGIQNLLSSLYFIRSPFFLLLWKQ